MKKSTIFENILSILYYLCILISVIIQRNYEQCHDFINQVEIHSKIHEENFKTLMEI